VGNAPELLKGQPVAGQLRGAVCGGREANERIARIASAITMRISCPAGHPLSADRTLSNPPMPESSALSRNVSPPGSVACCVSRLRCLLNRFLSHVARRTSRSTSSSSIYWGFSSKVSLIIALYGSTLLPRKGRFRARGMLLRQLRNVRPVTCSISAICTCVHPWACSIRASNIRCSCSMGLSSVKGVFRHQQSTEI
jgi:hypothetical protein